MSKQVWEKLLTKAATLHLLCGLPGAGKTTLAKQLECETKAVRLCPDEWIVRLRSSESVAERDALREAVEGLQWDVAKHLLRLGQPVILENGFWSKAERLHYRSEAKALGAKVKLHYLALSVADLWQRLSKRNQNLPYATFQVSKEELEYWFSLFEPPNKQELALYD